MMACTGSIDMKADIYDDVKSLVEQNNVQLRKLREEQLAEISASRVENNLANPEVEFDRLWGKGSDASKWGLSVTQSFEYPGVYRARRRSIDAMKEASELRYKVELANSVIEVKELLVEVAYCNKAMTLERKIVEDMKLVSQMLEKSFENGESTILEVNRAKIELANNVVKLNELERRRKECLARLFVMGIDMSQSEIEELTYPIQRIQELENYYSMIENDVVSQYADKLKRAEILKGKARTLEMLPEVTVGYLHEREEGTDFNGFSVGITLPFFSHRGKKALSRSLINAAELDGRMYLMEMRATVDASYNRAVKSKELLDMLATVFYNNNHVELLGKAFRGGQMSAIEYLREIAYYRESERDRKSVV